MARSINQPKQMRRATPDSTIPRSLAPLGDFAKPTPESSSPIGDSSQAIMPINGMNAKSSARSPA